MKNRVISLLIVCVMLFSALPIYAADGVWQAYVTLTPGTDATEMGVTWFSDIEGEAKVMCYESPMTVPVAPEAEIVAEATCELADEGEGYYSYKATLKGLKPATDYEYYLVNGDYASETRFFTTGGTDEFSFAMVSDVQIGAGGIAHDVEGWAKTLDIIDNDQAFAGTDFILTTGDQVKDAGNTDQYEGFFEHEELSSIPVAPSIGNHDTNSELFSYHFNVPNASEQHGVTEAGGDSWFRYNNALFIMLNTNSTKNDQHLAFAKQAIALNMDAEWRFLVFHHTVYTTGELKDSNTSTRGKALIAMCDELDIDAAFAGHEHLYTRSYIMKGNKAVTDKALYGDNYSSITDPDGTLYITNNTGSGCKYDQIEGTRPSFAAKSVQEDIPNVTKVNVDSDSFEMTVYRTSDMKVVDSFTINKTPETSGMEFSDVKENHWYYSAVEYAFGKGMMSGMTETTFGPNVATNRAMLVSVLWRFEGSPEGFSHSFSDVKSSHYFDKAVAWASANGIVAGKAADKYAPNDKLTREQMAAILYRYAAYKGKDTTAEADLSGFADLGKLGSYAVDAMKWANGKGIITGMNETTLDPRGNATRAQLASILQRFLTPKKYFTLSFDDGTTQDLRMIEILKKYDVDCISWNINTEGLYGASWDLTGLGLPGVSHVRFTEEELRSGIYDGYDVLVHTRTHPSLKIYDSTPIKMIEEVQGNADDIASITGIAPVGMAWPGGDTEYTDKSIEIILENTDIRFARGTTSTYDYSLPTQFMQWMPTCGFSESRMFDLAYDFITMEAEEDCLFYVWGHGFELDAYDTYDEFETLVRMMKANEGDITLVTNTEFYELYKTAIPSM
ncbi:MAG: S-layer homology domain-containing protein [Clostridia bacterium]|nr:S-layer homology domain-containing protein [Clostridia bacterium]